MKQKSIDLIHVLLESQPCTSSYLAENLGVSVRSVKNYVKSINEMTENTISSSHNGYQINPEKAKHLLNISDTSIPQTSNERVIYILNQLLKHNNNSPINVFDLCDNLYISFSTLKNELQKIKRKISKYDLVLNAHENEISLVGLEKNKRKLLSSILYTESNVNFVNLESIQKSFVDIDINYIKNIVLEVFGQYHYYINDYSLINLVLHLTIAVDRLRNKNISVHEYSHKSLSDFEDCKIAQIIAKDFEEKFDIKFNDTEIYEMALLIISRATTIDYKSINLNNLDKFIGKDCLELVNELIQAISSYYYIDLNEEDFMIRFALHIRNLLYRANNNHLSKNPLTSGIKTSCPLIYDISVSLAGIIKDKMNISINDDEIAYIAFHLGSTIEAQKDLTTKITGVLYCPNYYDMNAKLVNKINEHCLNDLLITNVLTSENDFKKIKETDLIIATIPLSNIYSTPIIQIDPFLSQKNLNNLKEKIHTIQEEKKKKEFKQYLQELITPELFEINKKIDNQKDCIHHMTKKMEKLGYVTKHFKNEVIERENMSSTAFGSFAIPHSMKLNSIKTGMNILINENGIDWNGKKVYLILMMSFNNTERYIFNEIFEPLTMILNSTENVKKIIESKDYQTFIDQIVSLYNQ